MIQTISVSNKKSRTFGWVQDPSNLRSLCDVVAVFDESSAKHKELVSSVIPKLVSESDGREALLEALAARPLKVPYSKLVGTSFTPRSQSRCNGIIQAAVKGQVRNFISDWPADNFVRWAHALGFIKYNYHDDTFSITVTGRELTSARLAGNELSGREREILINAMLSYPPAVRILVLLAKSGDVPLTKFELGRQLGFIGEDGFTSLPQNVFVKALTGIVSAKAKNSMKADWEGSSDKYARMIAGWLCKLGLAEQTPKDITVSVGKTEHVESIGQSYSITAAGLSALNRSMGKSRHKQIPKNICFEMLATRGSDREYIRTRRAYIIQFLTTVKKDTTIQAILDYLHKQNIEETIETVIDDMQGFINIGLDITVKANNIYKLNDKINDFIIPLTEKLVKSPLNNTKDRVRSQLKKLPHEYLSLIDLAYDSKQNRLFEMKTLELLTEECSYCGLHLGGSRKPDGIIYTNKLRNNYGAIIDTKAYSNGYNLPIAQADEMVRYIGENQRRDSLENPNKWWLSFGANVDRFCFLFISGSFVGGYAVQIERIARATGTNGAALTVEKLLLLAEEVKNSYLSHEDIWNRVIEERG